MNDDWRLRVDFDEEGLAEALTDRLEAAELEHELDRSFSQRVVVTRDGTRVFCYAGAREQAEAAERLIRSLATEHRWRIETALRRWHPIEEEWEDPDEPLPRTEADREAERATLMERERQESAHRGSPEWEVRVVAGSRGDAERFCERLEAEGLPAVRRWRYVVVGADDEDSAKALAERLRAEAPAGSDVKVEGSWQLAYSELPRNPFAFLGGLGG